MIKNQLTKNQKICKTGIYKIVNIRNGKFYIGSATNFHSRKHVHLSNLRKQSHTNKYLQNAYNIYGEDCFRFDLLEQCKIDDLIKIEQKYLDLFWDGQKNCYNINPKADSWLGRKHTFETKQKISLSHKGKHLQEETKEKIAKANRGKKHNDATKKKIGNKTKERQTNAQNCPQWGKRGKNSAHKKETIVIDSNNNKYIFHTVKEAAKFINANPSSLTRAVKNRKGYIKNFKIIINKGRYKKSGPKTNNKGSLNRNSKKVLIIDKNNKQIIASTVNHAAEIINSPPSSVSRALNSTGKIRGFIIKKFI